MAKLLREDDLAEMLGVTVRTIRHWRDNGTAPKAFRVGSTIRYREDDIAEWIAANTGSGRASNDLDPTTKGRIDAEAMAAAH